MSELRKTLAIWWRYGKEHGGDTVQINPPYLITEQLDQKLTAFRAQPADNWRWWQVDTDLIVERADPTAPGYGPASRIYYLLGRGLVVVENPHRSALDDEWTWRLYLADIFYDEGRDCWIKKALFCDLLVDRTCRHSRVLDLDDLADALTIGLIAPNEASDILRHVETIVNAVADGEFPYAEIRRGQAACRQLGW